MENHTHDSNSKQFVPKNVTGGPERVNSTILVHCRETHHISQSNFEYFVPKAELRSFQRLLILSLLHRTYRDKNLSLIPSNLSAKRECGPKRVNLALLVLCTDEEHISHSNSKSFVPKTGVQS